MGNSYKDKYKSIQLNLLRDKHSELIKWLEKLSDEEERSLNSIIIYILKCELRRVSGENDE
jgi:hypothetical protein